MLGYFILDSPIPNHPRSLPRPQSTHGVMLWAVGCFVMESYQQWGCVRLSDTVTSLDWFISCYARLIQTGSSH